MDVGFLFLSFLEELMNLVVHGLVVLLLQNGLASGNDVMVILTRTLLIAFRKTSRSKEQPDSAALIISIPFIARATLEILAKMSACYLVAICYDFTTHSSMTFPIRSGVVMPACQLTLPNAGVLDCIFW